MPVLAVTIKLKTKSQSHTLTCFSHYSVWYILGFLYSTRGLTEMSKKDCLHIFNFICRNSVISISSGIWRVLFVSVCGLYASAHVCLHLCVHYILTVCVCVQYVCAHMSVYTCAFCGITIHSAVIGGYYCHLLSHKRLKFFHWDFCMVFWHNCADQIRIYY